MQKQIFKHDFPKTPFPTPDSHVMPVYGNQLMEVTGRTQITDTGAIIQGEPHVPFLNFVCHQGFPQVLWCSYWKPTKVPAIFYCLLTRRYWERGPSLCGLVYFIIIQRGNK
jgi:hypothetical protein